MSVHPGLMPGRTVQSPSGEPRFANELRLFVFTQLRTQNRRPLLLDLP